MSCLDRYFNGVHNVMKLPKSLLYGLFGLKSLMTSLRQTASLVYHIISNIISNRVSYVSTDITFTPWVIVIHHVFPSLSQPFSSHKSIGHSMPFHPQRFRHLCHCPQHRPRSQLHIPTLPTKSHYGPAILQRAPIHGIFCSKQASPYIG